jgi:hypothetical protein
MKSNCKRNVELLNSEVQMMFISLGMSPTIGQSTKNEHGNSRGDVQFEDKEL